MEPRVIAKRIVRPDLLTRQRCRGCVAIAVALSVGAALASRPARACSAGNPDATPTTAIPRDGATDVPTATSFVILSGRQPSDVTLDNGGVSVPLEPPVLIGTGEGDTTDQVVQFWQVKATSGFLPPSAELALSAADPKGGRVTLTTVHTAAGYDKQAGSPATLRGLTLTRVRYPLTEIGSGDCVLAEYMGYITFDATVATVPGTPPASVVSTISLWPKNGGAAMQSRTFTGAAAYSGDPAGSLGPFSSAEWTPYLDPTLEYCAAITSFGFGDLARLPVTSNGVCADVIQVSAPGAGDAADASDDGAAVDAGGGLDGHTEAAAGEAGADAGAGSDGRAAADAGAPFADPLIPACSAAGGARKPSPIALVLLAAALRRRKRPS